MKYEKEMNEKLQEVGVSKDVLTDEELSQLQQEIEAEKRGDTVIDGVLHNPELIYRNVRKGERNNQ